MFVCWESNAQIISTVAGTGIAGYSGDGGPAILCEFWYPAKLMFDSMGNLYIAEASSNSTVRKINGSGIITTVAGNGNQGYSGDGGPGNMATLNIPTGICFDTLGNLLITEQNNHVVRKLNSSGAISTYAGTGSPGYSGDGGMSNLATFHTPQGIACSKEGQINIAEWYNNIVWRIDPFGIVSTFAGTGSLGYSGDGGLASQSEFNRPTGICVDDSGNVYVSDFLNHVIRKVKSGVITTVAGNGVQGYSGDGGPAISAQLSGPDGLTIDKYGCLYIADAYNHAIRKIDTNGIITTIAGNGTLGYSGDGGLAVAAQLYAPFGIALDTNGNLYIADTDNHVIRKVTNVVGVDNPRAASR